MKKLTYACLFWLISVLSNADAADFSTAAWKPTPLSPEGVITAPFPDNGEKAVYYFTVDLKKGDLLTQLLFSGQAGNEKRVELALLDHEASLVSAYWIHGTEGRKEAVRRFPIEKPGRQLLRVTVFGYQADEFRLEFGGSALPSSPAPEAASNNK
jgi:hypothetical protein